MPAVILLVLSTVWLCVWLKKILGRGLAEIKNEYLQIQNEHNRLLGENRELKQYIFDSEKNAEETIALYDITKEICKFLDLDSVFASFKERINKYIEAGDCLFLKADADLSPYNNYSIQPLKVDNSIIGYLAVNIIKEEDKDKFNILAQQFILAAKRTLLYQRVQEMVITDSLTRVFSRRYCLERFNEEIERSRNFKLNFSFLMADIDHFKDYNDRYGHLVGDAVLRDVAKTIKENIRQIDLIGRFGGEEFVIGLTETDRAEAIFVAERIRSAVEGKHIKVYDEELGATVSIGISVFPSDGQNTQGLIDKADSALYKAKQAGRNRVCVSY